MKRQAVYAFSLSSLFLIIGCKSTQVVVSPDSRTLSQAEDLRYTLSREIDNHKFFSYRQLWQLFPQTDIVEGNTIWDIYGFTEDKDPSSQTYTYTVLEDQCGNYRGEGDCYNREHSFPKSWWGRGKDTMYSDLFHIYPTDGYVNNIRGNYPFGETDAPEIVSQNGSRLGPSSFPGYSGTVFEPIDEFKGDLARTYFYMLTRYYDRIPGWSSPMLSNGDFSGWAKNLLLKWHREDPVSEKERNRNEAIQKLQGNFNPYVAKPKLAEEIWGETSY